MKADGMRVLCCRCRPPFAGGEHGGLVVFLDRRVAVFAMVAHAARVASLPIRRSNFSHCIVPHCGQGRKKRRWSEAACSRSIRLRPRIVGVETRKAFLRQPKVRALASAKAIGSPSPSMSPGWASTSSPARDAATPAPRSVAPVPPTGAARSPKAAAWTFTHRICRIAQLWPGRARLTEAEHRSFGGAIP